MAGILAEYWVVYVGWVAVASVVTLGVMGLDKRRAKKGRWRVSERGLHTLELIGGWPGSWLGQRLFRHKTRKVSYQLVFWAIGVLHLGLVAVMVWGIISPGG